MEFLNLLAVGFIVWVFAMAIKTALKQDDTDRYFQTTRTKTGVKFHNFFGIPNAKLK